MKGMALGIRLSGDGNLWGLYENGKSLEEIVQFEN